VVAASGYKHEDYDYEYREKNGVVQHYILESAASAYYHSNTASGRG